jgi:hypothetical protein
MRKTFGMHKQQKAVYKQGEQHVGKEQIAELLLLAESEDAEDRLTAAENLCPCHVRTRIPSVWEALYRMMEDADARVRQAAWHTIEDGGKPGDEAGVELLERICRQEKDPKVKRFAEHTLDKVLGRRGEKDMALLWLAARPEVKMRGKCDFCAATDVFVERDFQTMIPMGNDTRPALTCAKCSH